MQREREEDIEIDYPTLVLGHIKGISRLSTQVFGEFTNTQGIQLHFKETDREHAFRWGVEVLDRLVPDLIRDETFRTETDAITEEDGDVPACLARLKAIVNLLARKGFLFDRNITMRLKRPDAEEDE